MTKAKAIKEFCYTCAGDNTKEVTLCTVFDCPLWEYRTGSHVSSVAYQRRIEAAFKNWANDFKNMSREGANLAVFRAPGRATSTPGTKRDRLALKYAKLRETAYRGG